VSRALSVRRSVVAYMRPQESAGKGSPRWSYIVLEVRVVRLAVVLTVRRRFGPLPVSGVCSDLATPSFAPSGHGASADAVWCQLFVPVRTSFHPQLDGEGTVRYFAWFQICII